MAISESDLPKIEEIFLEQARAHFPPEVKFMEANASLYTSLYGEEWLRVVLLYDAPDLLLDAGLMNSFHRRTDQPMLEAGFIRPCSVGYVNIKDPTRRRQEKRTATQ